MSQQVQSSQAIPPESSSIETMPTPEPHPPEQFDVVCLTSREALLACRPEWETLLAETGNRNIFLEWQWSFTWLSIFDAKPWIVLIRDLAGRLIGVVPWMLERRQGVRQIRFVGAGLAQPDHLDLIAHPSQMDTVAHALALWLNTQRNQWDILKLDSLDQDSRLPAALDKILKPGLRRPTTPCPYIDLSDIQDWTQFQQARLSAHMRSKGLRYLQNVLNRENPGQVFYEQVTDPAAVSTALECLITQHRERWAEKETYTPFEDEQFLNFHRTFATEAMRRGWLGLYRLRVGEQTIATVYGFHYGDKFFDYQHALDNNWSKVSPGRQLISFIVQDAIARGHSEYDFLCGTEKYKYSWTQIERHDQNIIWFNGLRGWLWKQALRLKQKLKRAQTGEEA